MALSGDCSRLGYSDKVKGRFGSGAPVRAVEKRSPERRGLPRASPTTAVVHAAVTRGRASRRPQRPLGVRQREQAGWRSAAATAAEQSLLTRSRLQTMTARSKSATERLLLAMCCHSSSLAERREETAKQLSYLYNFVTGPRSGRRVGARTTPCGPSDWLDPTQRRPPPAWHHRRELDAPKRPVASPCKLRAQCAPM